MKYSFHLIYVILFRLVMVILQFIITLMILISRLFISKHLKAIIKTSIIQKLSLTNYFSTQNNHISTFKSSISQHQPSSQICQLKNYEIFLIKHNQSIKKPHQRLQKEEQRIIKKYLQDKKYEQLISFMIRNMSRILCYHQTSQLIDKSISDNWNYIEKQLKIPAVYALLNFRQNRSYDLWKGTIIDKIMKKGIQTVQSQELITFVYGELVNNKNLKAFTSLLQIKYSYVQVLNLIYNILKKSKELQLYHEEKQRIISYLSLLIEPIMNKKEDNLQKKKRSLLQSTVQPFFSSLNLDFERQIKLNNYYVDYLVYKKEGNKVEPYIIEVNGNYHYTLNGKLRGKQIIRNLIVNQYAPLRIIHHNQFLKSKGHRNKMAYIKQLLQMKDVNWQCKNQGTNSQWYVKVDEDFLKEIEK